MIVLLYILIDPIDPSNSLTSCDPVLRSEEELQIDMQTFINEENFSTFRFCCNDSSEIYLQVHNTMTHIPLACCEANISSPDILSNESTTLFLLLVCSMGCNNASKYLTVYGKISSLLVMT